MISGVLSQRPRAYVAAPVAPANGRFQAINWAFEQADDLTWGNLGILVADPILVVQLSQLHRLRSRGVRLGTAEQAARAFHGVIIAYCPDAAMLAAAEAVPGARAVAAHNEPLLAWVAAGTPQHLGGDVSPGLPRTTTPSPGGPGQLLQPSG